MFGDFIMLILKCRYTIYLISFFSLYELFPAFICVKNTGSLVNSLFEFKIFNPFPFTSSLSTSSSGMDDKSAISSLSPGVMYGKLPNFVSSFSPSSVLIFGLSNQLS